MKRRFICWYEYSGMETEGRTELDAPRIYEAEDEYEAMWKYHNYLSPGWGERFYEGSLEKYREGGDTVDGWGWRCEELIPK